MLGNGLQIREFLVDTTKCDEVVMFAVHCLTQAMKKRFTFSTGEHIEADFEDLQRILSDNKQYLENYEEVLSFSIR